MTNRMMYWSGRKDSWQAPATLKHLMFMGGKNPLWEVDLNGAGKNFTETAIFHCTKMAPGPSRE